MANIDVVKFNNKGEEINIQLTNEFKASLELLEDTNDSLFITGKAGTGKSTLLNYFVSTTDKTVVVLAFTGLAAINVGGETIHSFFRFPLGFIDPVKIRPNFVLQQKLKHIDTIVIDEISMVRADMIDAIDKSLRVNKNNDRPFGGVQMIFIGDLYQLPPIVGDDIKTIYEKYYNTPYFFSAEVFMFYKMPYINLEKIHRQKDNKFINILNSIRERKDLSKSLSELNKHVRFDLKEIVKGETVSLTTVNKKAKEINDYFLNKLKTDIFSYEAKITGEFDRKSYPTDELLKLKVGAKVMFLRNDDFYVNGDIGIIVELKDNEIIVNKNDQLISVKKTVWEKYKYSYVASGDENKKESIEKTVIGSFVQYPLKLAWAITIHKCIEENQKVKTKDGWIPIKNINVGDKVLTHNMTYESVLNKFESGIQDVFEIKTKFGHTLIATKDHPLISNNKWTKVEDLNIGDYLTMISPNIDNFIIKNDDISYLLGYLVGDGSYSGLVKKDKYRMEIVIHSIEKQIINKLDSILKNFNLNHKIDKNLKNRNVHRIRLQNKKFREFLLEKGLDYVKGVEKDVPIKIMTSNLIEKSNFLCGLFDSDGSVDKNHIRLVNISLNLLKNVQLLLLEFGIGSTIKEIKKSKYTKNKTYVLKIITYDNNKYQKYIGFNILNKKEKLKNLILNKKKKDKSQYYIINKYDELYNILKENFCLKKTEYSLKSKTFNLNKFKKIKNKIIKIKHLLHYFNYEYRDEEIIDIKYIGKSKTYDIEVENNHSFIAQGFICHNSQGQTYNKVFIDFHNGTFTSGQSYVALSRCRSLEGLTMKREMRMTDVILDDKINKFFTMFKNIIE